MEIFTKAEWIAGTKNSAALAPPELFRCPVFLSTHPARALWRISAKGLFIPRINGSCATDELLLPGWTDYRKRIPYREFEVARLLHEGENLLEILLAPGWYCGEISRAGFPDGNLAYGLERSWCGELHILYEDGSKCIFPSTAAWRCTADSGILFSDFYRGEMRDYRIRPHIFQAARTVKTPRETLCAYKSPPVRILKKLSPRTVRRTASGSFVFDFGQNISGWTILTFQAPSGQKILLKHGEILNSDGTVYTANLRKASGCVTVIADGKRHAFQPSFTYFGFRYCELSGVEDFESVQAAFISCDLKRDGRFRSSNSLVNRLFQNIIRGQQCNSVEIPTDCPQRDERLGWLGDIQVFAKTALYNFDCRSFFLKYLEDIESSASEKGDFPPFVPFNRPESFEGSAGWADAPLELVWELYRFYGDSGILRRYHPMLLHWLDHLNNTAENGLRKTSRYGDWCAFDNSTPPEFIATAFYARAAKRMADIAEALGMDSLKREHLIRFDQICSAFADAFIRNGSLTVKNQSAALLALGFDLLPENMQSKVLRDLLENITQIRQYRISTGFLTTGLLLEVLSRFGCHDTAGRILTERRFPSLLYPVTRGATTIWERWDGIREDGTPADPKMNSFNHYALGSFGAWFYEYLCGIQPEEPGFRKVCIQPHPVPQLKWAEAKFRGIRSAWFRRNGEIRWEVDTPVEAKLIGPDGEKKVAPGHYQFNKKWEM